MITPNISLLNGLSVEGAVANLCGYRTYCAKRKLVSCWVAQIGAYTDAHGCTRTDTEIEKNKKQTCAQTCTNINHSKNVRTCCDTEIQKLKTNVKAHRSLFWVRVWFRIFLRLRNVFLIRFDALPTQIGRDSTSRVNCAKKH